MWNTSWVDGDTAHGCAGVEKDPRELARSYVVPSDTVETNSTRCESKRPIALLGPLMKLLEMALVRRMLPMLEGRLTGRLDAAQPGRSTENLLGDLDAFVERNTSDGFAAYEVGLDIEGAYDSVELPRRVETLGGYAIPEILVRFIGHWLARGHFRTKLGTQGGVVLSRPRRPTRGAPQGGALSPLLSILRIYEVVFESCYRCCYRYDGAHAGRGLLSSRGVASSRTAFRRWHLGCCGA